MVAQNTPYAPYSSGATSVPGSMAPSFTQQLRQQTAGVRVMQERLGVRKALGRAQVALAANTFHAEGSAISASKKLIDTNHPSYKAVTAILSQARRYWLSVTVPYPLNGIRLIRRSQVPIFNETMQRLRGELNLAVKSLQEAYAVIRDQAQERLGDLYDANDYPSSIEHHFTLTWDYPSVEPPDYLKQIHPDIYKEMQDRAEARLQAAVAMAEEAFAAELQALVTHMVDRLTASDDGKQKVFRDSCLGNLKEFFRRFESMNIGSNEQLTQLVNQAKEIVAGVDVGELRKETDLRETVKGKLDEVKAVLDTMVVDKPTRKIEFDELEE